MDRNAQCMGGHYTQPPAWYDRGPASGVSALVRYMAGVYSPRLCRLS